MIDGGKQEVSAVPRKGPRELAVQTTEAQAAREGGALQWEGGVGGGANGTTQRSRSRKRNSTTKLRWIGYSKAAKAGVRADTVKVRGEREAGRAQGEGECTLAVCQTLNQWTGRLAVRQ